MSDTQWALNKCFPTATPSCETGKLWKLFKIIVDIFLYKMVSDG